MPFYSDFLWYQCLYRNPDTICVEVVYQKPIATPLVKGNNVFGSERDIIHTKDPFILVPVNRLSEALSNVIWLLYLDI